jgi:Holliday junction resolvase RusA-like endonuclease
MLTSATTAAIEFVVPGELVPWARARGGKTVPHYTPSKQANYMTALKLICSTAMKGAPPLEGPIKLTLLACYPWPRAWSQKKRDANRWRWTKPDYDNIGKIVGDALNKIAWRDDAQIADATVHKFFGETPGLAVRIERL